MLQVNRNIADVPIAAAALIYSCSMIGNVLLRSIQGDSPVIGSVALSTCGVAGVDFGPSNRPCSSFIHRRADSSGAISIFTALFMLLLCSLYTVHVITNSPNVVMHIEWSLQVKLQQFLCHAQWQFLQMRQSHTSERSYQSFTQK